MANARHYAMQVADELRNLAGNLDQGQLDALEREIAGANQILVAGAGRSGLSIRGFAMRLMHFGYRAYVVGEVCTPAIGAGDLLVIASGSGETQGMLAMARKAHQFGARVALLTMRPDSAIAAISDLVVTLNTDPPVINGAVQPEDWDVDNALTIRPSGAPFEIGLMIALDGVVYSLMVNNRMGIAQLLRMHANLE